MDVKDFYFDLPEELIAQDPLKDRSSSRLLVLDKDTGEVQHRVFRDIVEYLRPGDCLVINDTKVIPARLFGVKKDTGAKIEVLLLKRRENDIWETLVRPGKKCRPGTVIEFGEGLLSGTVVETVDDGNQEWWCLTKGGEMWNYGVDDTKIADGDAFEFTFTEGY